MAINYTKIGWDTSKYVNPTNMNQMDDGIKAACDGVDTLTAADYLPKTAGVNNKLKGDLWLHGTGNRTVVVGDQTAGATGYLQLSNNQHYGLLFPLSLTGDRQYRLPDKTGTLALAEDVVKPSYYGSQTIETTGTGGFPLTLKGGDASEATLRFMNKNSSILGYIGVAANDKPVFYGASGAGQKEIALKNEFESTTIGDVTFYKNGNTVSFYGLASNLSTDTAITFGQLPVGFRPKNTYTISPFYSDSAVPYPPIGTVWVTGSNGSIVIFKGNQTTGYLSGTYLAG